eukprot:9491668-Pyramimonas_sp.AAC.2
MWRRNGRDGKEDYDGVRMVAGIRRGPQDTASTHNDSWLGESGPSSGDEGQDGRLVAPPRHGSAGTCIR